ncbi:MAG TPA: DNA-formamidopyrimidine glycosylase family protein [Candidatus Dormibacteraeota bacterium]|jgi:endonuclease-8|nr:DNA-formamidopyrimidine glycosylase family protein [Candidatus Dormibacteraeota bacterium]
MPEGDTIHRVASMLRSALEGKVVVSARPDPLRRLAGTTVTAVEPVGKHLVIRFDNGLALHSHMRMRGVWQVYRPGERWRRPAWQLKAALETADSVAVCFSAPIVELIRDVAARVGHLGPDIVAKEWSGSEAVARARMLDAMPIGDVLLDQRVVAGIGNVYRCESLWSMRINPWKAVRELDDETLRSLFNTARDAMQANLGGEVRRRFPGYGTGAVHGRGRRPCPRCGTPIRVRAMGEHARLVYWCPKCQDA